jgi:hypothetical protein
MPCLIINSGKLVGNHQVAIPEKKEVDVVEGK